MRGIHRSPVNSPHKGQWRGALMFSLFCAWTNGWVNNRDPGDLRRHRAHYDINVMEYEQTRRWHCDCFLWYPSLVCATWSVLRYHTLKTSAYFGFCYIDGDQWISLWDCYGCVRCSVTECLISLLQSKVDIWDIWCLFTDVSAVAYLPGMFLPSDMIL